MIAVVADDFTGAAEIGGVALRHGWKVVIDTRVQEHYEADLVVIATDTRSQQPEHARKTIRKITSELMHLNPEFIYKKTDSVLRGNVVDELEEQMKVSGKKKTLLIPANPSLNRVIRNGVYYYHGVPLHESGFSASSPERTLSSHVLDLLGAQEGVSVISKSDRLPEQGIIIGNTTEETDPGYWASQVDSDTIPAGGSGFFTALLQRVRADSPLLEKSHFELGKGAVYVCGSAFPMSRKVVDDARKAGHCVAYMPADLFDDTCNQPLRITQWKDSILRGIQSSGSVIVAIDKIDNANRKNLPSEICSAVATVIHQVMESNSISELIIEGGATASAVIHSLNYRKFYPSQELAPGVIRMKAEENQNMYITMKPGSYSWPASIWNY